MRTYTMDITAYAMRICALRSMRHIMDMHQSMHIRRIIGAIRQMIDIRLIISAIRQMIDMHRIISTIR